MGIGMAEQAGLVRNRHAAQDQRAPLDQDVAVIALADFEWWQRHALSLLALIVGIIG
jgi:hypothetical protein